MLSKMICGLLRPFPAAPAGGYLNERDPLLPLTIFFQDHIPAHVLPHNGGGQRGDHIAHDDSILSFLELLGSGGIPEGQFLWEEATGEGGELLTTEQAMQTTNGLGKRHRRSERHHLNVRLAN